jgi:hypothetical protein
LVSQAHGRDFTLLGELNLLFLHQCTTHCLQQLLGFKPTLVDLITIMSRVKSNKCPNEH